MRFALRLFLRSGSDGAAFAVPNTARRAPFTSRLRRSSLSGIGLCSIRRWDVRESLASTAHCVFLWPDVLQLNRGFGLFGLFGCFRFHRLVSFCGCFSGLVRRAPNTVRRPALTSRFGIRSFNRIGFAPRSLRSRGFPDPRSAW